MGDQAHRAQICDASERSGHAVWDGVGRGLEPPGPAKWGAGGTCVTPRVYHDAPDVHQDRTGQRLHCLSHRMTCGTEKRTL